MRSVQPALATLINSGIFQFAHIYTITLFGSLGGQTTIRLTDAPLDVTLGRLWKPTDLSGLAAWYDASNGVFHDAGATLATNGQTVQQWNDLSGHGANLSLTGSGVTFVKNGGPGGTRPTVNFTALGGMVSGASAVALGNPKASGFAVGSTHINTRPGRFVAFQAANPVSRGAGFSGGVPHDWDNLESGIFAYVEQNGGFAFEAYRSSDSIVDGSGSRANSVALDTFYRLGSIFDGTNNTFYLNNAAGTPVAEVGPGTAFGATGSVGVGGYIAGAGSEFLNGNVSEAIVTNTALSSADRATLDQYWAWKWFGTGSAPLIGTANEVYSASGVRVDQKANKRLAHWKRGLDVDQAVLVLAPRTTDPLTGAAFPDKIGSVPFIEAARGGALDGADVQIDRVFFPSWPQTGPILPFGSITIFAGTPAEVDTNDSMVVVTLNDYRQLLQNKFPRNFYQLGCTHTLYDTGCTLLASSFQASSTVAAGSTRQTIIAAAALSVGGSGTFTLGKITFTSGLNSGFSRTVRMWDGVSTLQLLNPMPFTVSVGDSFNVFAGCDKQLSTCQAFANQANFDGDPFIPDATTAA